MRNPTPLLPKSLQAGEEPRPILTVQFPRDIYNRVRAEGAAAERTPSYIVRKAVKEFIDRLDNADALKAAG